MKGVDIPLRSRLVLDVERGVVLDEEGRLIGILQDLGFNRHHDSPSLQSLGMIADNLSVVLELDAQFVQSEERRKSQRRADPRAGGRRRTLNRRST